jgi:hypothetical protein
MNRKSYSWHHSLGRSIRREEQSSVQARKIFVIRQTIRPFDSRSGQDLHSTHAAGKTIRRILVFDDHPDSLRLVLGSRVRPQVNRSVPQRENWWDFIVASLLILTAMILMFSPFFPKLWS